MKARIFWCFKFSNYDVIFLRNVRNGHFGTEPKYNRTTTAVVATRTTENLESELETSRNSRDRSDLQLLCRYNSCKAVAKKRLRVEESLPEGK